MSSKIIIKDDISTSSFVGDFIKYVPAKIIPGLIAFVTIPIVTKLFSPKVFGDYAIALSAVLVMVNISSWLPISVLRFYPIYLKKKKLNYFNVNLLVQAILSTLVLSLLFYSLIYLFGETISYSLKSLLNIGVVVFALTSFFEIFLSILRVERSLGLYNFTSIWKNSTGLVIGLILIKLVDYNIKGLFWGTIISIIVILPLMWKETLKSKISRIDNYSNNFLKETLKYSFPLMVGNLAAWVLNLSDRYILLFYRGSFEVGVYSANYMITEKILITVSSLFILSSRPISIRIWEEKGEYHSINFIISLIRFYLIICLPIAAGLSALSKPLISLFTAEQYIEGHSVIVFIAIGVFLLGFQQTYQTFILFSKKTYLVTFALFFSGLLNIVLNFIFIPHYGYKGAAVTTLISYSLLAYLIYIYSRRLIKWSFPFRTLFKTATSSILMGIFVLFLVVGDFFSELTTILISIIFGNAIYFLILFILGEFSPKEKKIVKKRINNTLCYFRKDVLKKQKGKSE